MGKVDISLLHNLQDCSNGLLNTMAYQEDKYASLMKPSINRGTIFTFVPQRAAPQTQNPLRHDSVSLD